MWHNSNRTPSLKKITSSRKSHFPKIRPAARPPQPPHRMVLPNSATTKQAKHYNCQPLRLHCSSHPVLLDLFSIPPWTVARHALFSEFLGPRSSLIYYFPSVLS